MSTYRESLLYNLEVLLGDRYDYEKLKDYPDGILQILVDENCVFPSWLFEDKPTQTK